MMTEVENSIDIKKSAGWVIAFSIILIILGIIAIFSPAIASAFSTVVLAWVTIASGLILIIESFKSKPLRGFWLNLVIGLCYVVAGTYILFNVRTALLALTFAFGVLFIVEGIFTIIMAFVNRSGHRMSWLVALNGVITLILGILVVNRFPFSALWLIGLYVGISLLMTGISLLSAALVVRRALRD